MSTGTDVLRTRRLGAVVEITLDRPPANAIDLATSRAMGEVFAGFRDDPRLRVAVLRTGGDRFFSAGWDLKAAATGEPVDGDYGVGGFGGIQLLPRAEQAGARRRRRDGRRRGLRTGPVGRPDLRRRHRAFALPEINAGTLADAATLRLPARIPHHVAMELLLTGRWMDAAEAHRWGLVNEVHPADRLADRVLEVADAAGRGTAAGVRGDQGGAAREPAAELRRGDAPDRGPRVPGSGHTVRLTGPSRGGHGVRRAAPTGVEGALTWVGHGNGRAADHQTASTPTGNGSARRELDDATAVVVEGPEDPFRPTATCMCGGRAGSVNASAVSLADSPAAVGTGRGGGARIWPTPGRSMMRAAARSCCAMMAPTARPAGPPGTDYTLHPSLASITDGRLRSPRRDHSAGPRQRTDPAASARQPPLASPRDGGPSRLGRRRRIGRPRTHPSAGRPRLPRGRASQVESKPCLLCEHTDDFHGRDLA